MEKGHIFPYQIGMQLYMSALCKSTALPKKPLTLAVYPISSVPAAVAHSLASQCCAGDVKATRDDVTGRVSPSNTQGVHEGEEKQDFAQPTVITSSHPIASLSQ